MDERDDSVHLGYQQRIHRAMSTDMGKVDGQDAFDQFPTYNLITRCLFRFTATSLMLGKADAATRLYLSSYQAILDCHIRVAGFELHARVGMTRLCLYGQSGRELYSPLAHPALLCPKPRLILLSTFGPYASYLAAPGSDLYGRASDDLYSKSTADPT